MWEEKRAWTSPTAFLNKADLLNERRQTEVGIMKQHSGFRCGCGGTQMVSGGQEFG